MTASNPTRTSEEEISARAYEIWEAEGRPEGRDKEHWYMAKELLAGISAPEDGGAEGATTPEPAATSDPSYVRPAGRKKMDMPPSSWSKTDEEIDESFPASDPPGNY